MPTYLWHCPDCDAELEIWQSIHLDEVPEHDCGAKLVKIITPPALHGVGVHGSETRRVDQREREWSKDMKSYQNLRMEGHQPRKITGAHKLEQTAMSAWEIRTGQKHSDEKVRGAQEEARVIVRDAGLPVPKGMG